MSISKDLLISLLPWALNNRGIAPGIDLMASGASETRLGNVSWV
jgi:hypothetical protein